MKEAVALIEKDQKYPVEDAVKLAREEPSVKFDASVEVHVRLAIDPKKTEQRVRAQTSLPHGTGKALRVAAFVTPEKEKEAEGAGADLVGGEELIKQIKESGKTDFDVAVAEPGIMKNLTQIAKILGQRKLMPNSKTGTVGPDIKKLVMELKGGKVDIKTDDSGNIHQIIGKVSFDEEKLVENFKVLLDTIKKARPEGVKSGFIKSVSLSTSMGPAIKIAN